MSPSTFCKNIVRLILVALGFGVLGAQPATTYRRGEERRITITAKPEFRIEEFGLRDMILPSSDGDVTIHFVSEAANWYATMPKNKALTFTFWQTVDLVTTRDGQRHEIPGFANLEVIRDGDTVLFDAAVCPVHGVRMERTEIELMTALPSQALLSALPRFSGGPGFRIEVAVGGLDFPKTDRGYKCPECVAAFAQWKKVTTTAGSTDSR